MEDKGKNWRNISSTCSSFVVDEIDQSFNEPTWTENKCDNSGPREEHSSTLLQDYIITIGGSEGNNRLNDVIVFNILTSTWQRIIPTGDVIAPKGGHSACLYNNQIIGYGGHTTDGLSNYIVTNETGTLTIKSTERKNYSLQIFWVQYHLSEFAMIMDMISL